MKNKNQNHKKLRLRQHQVISPEIFDKIVREDIERCFHKRYLTDSRLQDLFSPRYRRKIGAEVVTPQQLKEEMHDLFFKSFYKVCTDTINTRIGTGITHEGILTPITVGGSIPEIIKQGTRIYWRDIIRDVIESHRIVGTYKDLDKKTGYEPYTGKDIINEYRLMYVYFIALGLSKKDGEGLGIELEEENDKEKEEMNQQENNNHTKKLKWYNIVKYVIFLNSRVELIVDYILYKNIYGPLIEASRGMRQKTEEERNIVLKDGTEVYEFDMYGTVKQLIYEWMRGLKTDEEYIWKPKQHTDKENGNVYFVGRDGWW